MGGILALLGTAIILIGGPVKMFKQYRRALRKHDAASGADRLPQAQLRGAIPEIRIERDALARQRHALQAGIFRGLLPAWLMGLLLLLLAIALR